MADEAQVPPGVDPTVPSPARMYDYMLRGSHNYQADRDAVDKLRAQMPELEDAAYANRGFHQRAARWIAQQGVRQFLDIGSGLPTFGNTHATVQKIHPRARVAYVDNDPVVAAYATELLAANPTTILIQADLRDPATILGHPQVRELIDFTQPTGVLMTLLLHFVPDTDQPWDLVGRYTGALAPGSYLAISHGTSDYVPPRTASAITTTYTRASQNAHLRSKADIARFFTGLHIIPPYPGAEPALTHLGNWGAEDIELADSDGSRWAYCAVARK
jgi:hypothetical protein